MKNRIYLVLLLFLPVTHAVAQQMYTPEEFLEAEPAEQAGDSLAIFNRLNIHQDERIGALLKLHAKNNRRQLITKGYRVQIYFGSGADARENALREKSNFLTDFPETKAYILFHSPDFKLRVGDFRTKSEALKLQKKLLKIYPGAFIVPDDITFPEVEERTGIN